MDGKLTLEASDNFLSRIQTWSIGCNREEAKYSFS